jgi:hypothetical protein
MNDKQVQDLIRGQFMNAVLLNMWTYARANRCRVQQGQEVQYVHKVPLIIDITTSAIILFWLILLGGTMILSILGLIMIVFQID